MDDVLHSKIKNIKLSPWYFAVHWASIQLQEKITDMEQLGVDPTYDIRQLQQLQDLEQFLKMTWDQWMDGWHRSPPNCTGGPMSQVLEIEDLWFEDGGTRIVVDAVVDGMVVVHAQTHLDPPEWGPALCRGSFYLHEEDLIPASDDGLRKLLSERIDDWAPIDTSDWDD